MDINKKVSKVLDDIVFESMERNWKHALEALHDLASMVKSAGMGNQQFQMIMENLQNEMKIRGGPEVEREWEKAVKNKDHYLKGGKIILI